MCIWDLAVYDCGHNGSFSRRDGGCALPTSECNKERKNAVKHYMPWNCPDCAERLSRGIPLHPEDHIHPTERSVQQPMFPVALPPQPSTRRGGATIRKTPSPPNSGRRDMAVVDEEEDGYDFSEFAEYANYASLPQKRLSTTSPTKFTKRQRISRSQYSGDTPAMFGRLGNIAQDLSDIGMPSARERRSGVGFSPTSVRLHGTVQDVSELPPTLIPAMVTISPPRRRCQRSPVLLQDAGVTKRRKPSSPPARRISPTQLRAPHATHAAAANAPYSANTYSGYAAASQAATRQKQGATRAYQETLDDVKHMIQTGYPRDEIMASAKFAMLSQKDQDEVFWQQHQEHRARENETKDILEGRRMHKMKTYGEDKRDARRRKGGCAVM